MRSKKRLITVTVLAIALLGGISWMVQLRIKAQIEVEIAQSLSAVLKASHQTLRLWFEEHEANAKLWGGSLEVRQATQDLLGAPQNLMSLIVSHAQPQVRVWLQKISVNYGYRGYYIVDSNNVNISASENRDIGVKSLAAAQPGFLEKVWGGESVVSLPQNQSAPLHEWRDAWRGAAPAMFVGTPIRDETGQIIAALVFHLDPSEEFADIFQHGWFGASGETFAFDVKGRLLSNSRFDEQLRGYGLVPLGEPSILNIEIRELTTNLVPGEESRLSYEQLPFTYMVRRATAGDAGISIKPYLDYRGVEVVGAWLWDPELELGIATELDASEAFQTLNTTRALISALTLLVASLLAGMAALVLAILKKREAEALAQKSEQRLSQFFYAAFEKIFFLDGDRIIDANPAALSALGYSYEQVINYDLLDIIDNPFRQNVAALIETSDDEPYEAEIITANGSRISVEIRIKMVVRDGAPLKVAGLRDITKRRIAEEALSKAYEELEVRVLERTADLHKANLNMEREIAERKQVEDELRKLSRAVEQSPVSIVITDLNGMIEYVNPKFTDATGYSFAEAVGKNPRILRSGKQTLEFYRDLWGTITSGKEWRGEFHNKKKSGELFWEYASISPVVNEHGEATNFIAVKEDVTQRKHAEAQVHQLLRQNRTLTQRLFEAQETERRHLARELHDEFGQWLTAIQLHSQVITELTQDNQKSTIYNSAKTINQSAEQMNKVTRSIIRELRPQALDDLGLVDSLRELVNQWRAYHQDVVCELSVQCGLTKKCELDEIDEAVKISLYRVVQESLTNAAKYSRASNVSVSLTCEKQRGEHSAYLALKVQDNGDGMDLATPKSGMGLAGMRERILAVGGEFDIDSQPGQGVCIEVNLPVELDRE